MAKSLKFKWIALAIVLAAALALGPALWADEIHEAAKRGGLEKVRSLVAADPALVADLIKADGLTIFYAGFFPEDIEAFKKEIDFLAGSGERCDLAFINTTDGDDHFYAAYVMEKLRPKAVLPMDPDHRIMDYKKMAEWLKATYPGVLTGCVENPGDAHVYDQRNASLNQAFYFSPRMGVLLGETRLRKTK